MTQGGARFTSGDWRTKAGSEDEFISRWTDFVRWAKDSADGSQEFYLIQQADDPRHFVSFGRWSSKEAVDSWRQSDEFGPRLGRCRELCDDFQALDFTLVASV
jgi:heme-degrading monooxygenase HmoA